MLNDPQGEWVSSRWIARSVNSHPVMIRRVLARLEDAGIVRARKGARGGYRLRRSGGRVTLWQVYAAMRDDGPFGMHSSPPNPRCPVGRSIQQQLRQVYARTEVSMRGVLGRATLRSLRRQLAGPEPAVHASAPTTQPRRFHTGGP